MFKKRFGIIVDKAFSGEEAIVKVKQKLMSPWWKSYRLILMDYYMPPSINGAEASLKIKQILKHNNYSSYIACLTSQREGDFEFNKSLKNFDWFFSKPIHPEDVKKVISELFEVK
jgi:CheY-like chemotaxis protein